MPRGGHHGGGGRGGGGRGLFLLFRHIFLSKTPKSHHLNNNNPVLPIPNLSPNLGHHFSPHVGWGGGPHHHGPGGKHD